MWLRRELLYDMLTEFGTPMKLVVLIKVFKTKPIVKTS
jgi:hypothetical protein